MLAQAQTTLLTPEDHSIFASCVYTSQDWVLRALVKAGCSGEALP